MKKHSVYQKALMLVRILRTYGIEADIVKALEMIMERDHLVLDREFLHHLDIDANANASATS